MEESTSAISYLLLFSNIIIKLLLIIFTAIILYIRFIQIPNFESGKSFLKNYKKRCNCHKCISKNYTYPQSNLYYYHKLKSISIFLILTLLSFYAYGFLCSLPTKGSQESKENSSEEKKILSELVPYISDISDPYEILGLKDGAEINLVKKSYRKKMVKLHPDRLPSHYSEFLKSKISERLQLIQKAYNTLTDPDLFERFNREGAIAQESFNFDFGIPLFFNKSENAARILILYFLLAVIIGVIIYKVFKNNNNFFGNSENKVKILATKLYQQRQNGLRNGNDVLNIVCLALIFEYNIKSITLKILQKIDPSIVDFNLKNSKTKFLKSMKQKFSNEFLKKPNNNFLNLLQSQNIDIGYLNQNFELANIICLLLKSYTSGDLSLYLKDFKEFNLLIEKVDITLVVFNKLAAEYQQVETLKQIITYKNKLINPQKSEEKFYKDFNIDVINKSKKVDLRTKSTCVLEFKFLVNSNKEVNKKSEKVENKEIEDNESGEDNLTLLNYKKENNTKIPVLSHNESYPFPVVENYHIIIKEDKEIIYNDNIIIKSNNDEEQEFEETLYMPIYLQKLLFEYKNNRLKVKKRSKIKKELKLKIFIFSMFSNGENLNKVKEIVLPIEYNLESNGLETNKQEKQENEDENKESEEESEEEEIKEKGEIEELIEKYEKDNFFNMDAESDGAWYYLGSRNILEFGCNLILLYVLFLVVLSTNTGRVYLKPIVDRGVSMVKGFWGRIMGKLFNK